jgi:hypothetical protein
MILSLRFLFGSTIQSCDEKEPEIIVTIPG